MPGAFLRGGDVPGEVEDLEHEVSQLGWVRGANGDEPCYVR